MGGQLFQCSFSKVAIRSNPGKGDLMRRSNRAPALLAFAALLLASRVHAVNVLTHHNDNAHTGANLSETLLTPSNVNQTTFGKLFAYPVDGSVYAQPLYMQGLVVAGAAHNVVFIATMHNSVYAFDADNAAAAAKPLWSVNLGPSAP